MSRRYTKADLEELVALQLEKLNTMQDSFDLMKLQNDHITSANKKLKDEINDFKLKLYPTGKRRLKR